MLYLIALFLPWRKTRLNLCTATHLSINTRKISNLSQFFFIIIISSHSERGKNQIYVWLHLLLGKNLAKCLYSIKRKKLWTSTIKITNTIYKLHMEEWWQLSVFSPPYLILLLYGCNLRSRKVPKVEFLQWASQTQLLQGVSLHTTGCVEFNYVNLEYHIHVI